MEQPKKPEQPVESSSIAVPFGLKVQFPLWYLVAPYAKFMQVELKLFDLESKCDKHPSTTSIAYRFSLN